MNRAHIQIAVIVASLSPFQDQRTCNAIRQECALASLESTGQSVITAQTTTGTLILWAAKRVAARPRAAWTTSPVATRTTATASASRMSKAKDATDASRATSTLTDQTNLAAHPVFATPTHPNVA